MTIAQEVLGFDVAKVRIDVFHINSGQRERLSTTRVALARFARQARGALVVLEASGGYERPVPAVSAISRHLWYNNSNTPASFHSRKRCSAMAEEQRLVLLSPRQGQPVRITNQIASMARRWATNGRPPRG